MNKFAKSKGKWDEFKTMCKSCTKLLYEKIAKNFENKQKKYYKTKIKTKGTSITKSGERKTGKKLTNGRENEIENAIPLIRFYRLKQVSTRTFAASIYRKGNQEN